MALPELSPGVYLASHHVDSLEISCSVEQVALSMEATPALTGTSVGQPDRTKRDHRNSTMTCELEAKLDYLKRRGTKLNLDGERATGWRWREADAEEQVRLLPGVQRKGQAFGLETNDWLLMVAPFGSARPRFSFQVRSAYLLEVGPSKAYREIVRWWNMNIRPILDGMSDEDPPRWRISRIDLAADLAGVDIVAADLPCFVTRARRSKEHHAGHDAAGRHIGRRFTGFEIGKRGSPFYARIYDKAFQAESNAPIRKVWEAHGYNAEIQGETVWRIEFELRSQFLRELVRDDGSRLSDDPERTLRQDLDALWQEVVLNRLVLKKRTGDKRTVRRQVRDWWDQLAKLNETHALAGGSGAAFKREPPVSNDISQFLAATLRGLANVGLLSDSPRFSDCVGYLRDFYLATGGRDGFAELIARAETRRDPLMPFSKQAIELRAIEIAESCEFDGTVIRHRILPAEGRQGLSRSTTVKRSPRIRISPNGGKGRSEGRSERPSVRD